jgi:hypothetical protein
MKNKNLKKEDFKEEYIASVLPGSEEEESDCHKGTALDKSGASQEEDVISSGECQEEMKSEVKEGSFHQPISAKRDRGQFWYNAQILDANLQAVRDWLTTGKPPTRRMANNLSEVQRKLCNQLDRIFINKESIICFKFYNTKSQKYKALIIVPQDSKQQILRQYHDSPYAGHMGYSSTLDNIRKAYYWPKMSTEVKLYCQNCAVCEINNLKYLRKPKAPLKQFPANRVSAECLQWPRLSNSCKHNFT